MASVYLVPTFGIGYQSLTNGGLVNNAGFIDTFEAGSTTVTSAYTTSSGITKHANPIVLDSAGRIPSGGEVWSLAGVAMKFVIKDSTSSAIQTLDNIYGINDPTSINNLGPAGATVSSAINMNAAAINEAQGASIAIAGAVNLTTATGNYLAFTGAGTVTSITLSPAGVYRETVITNTCAFTNNTNIIMLGAASITASPGDIVGFRGEASGVVRNVVYQKASRSPVFASASDFNTQAANAVLIGPASGIAALPTFRTLTSADIPSSLGSALVLLTSITAINVSSITVSSAFITTGYDIYKWEISELAVSVASSTSLRLRCSTDGSTFLAGGNDYWESAFYSTDGGALSFLGGASAQLDVAAAGLGITGTRSTNVTIQFAQPASTSPRSKKFRWEADEMLGGGGMLTLRGSGFFANTTAPVMALQISPSTGSISQASAALYAFKNS